MKGPRAAINGVLSEAKRTHGHRSGTAGVLGSKRPLKENVRCCQVVFFKNNCLKSFYRGIYFLYWVNMASLLSVCLYFQQVWRHILDFS